VANKDELIDYAIRAGAPLEVVENRLLKTKERYMSRWKRFGRITLQTKTIFGMRMNIKYIIKEKSQKTFLVKLHFKIIRNTNIL
jgi:hypothetical protein